MDSLVSTGKRSFFDNIKHFVKIKYVIRIAMYAMLLDLAFVFIYPFLYMIITAIKSPQDVADTTVNWLVNEIHWSNFTLSWAMLKYPTRLLRTIVVVGLCTFGHVISCSFIGYGFARFEFPGKGTFFGFLLLSIIVPTQTIIIPLYMLYANLGFTGTELPLILPTFFGFGFSGGLFIFIFRQFYLSLPKSLEEAASIDGCGPFKTFFKIAFPSSRSSIMVCMVLSLVWHWNDYFEPTIYITKEENYLLPMALPGLYKMIQNSSSSLSDIPGMSSAEAVNLSMIYTEAVAMAATVLVVLPVFILYMFLQKQFIQGVERSGITGE